ncbi:hypothetical protein NMG60_11030828 [Bertholletia excelsa]
MSERSSGGHPSKHQLNSTPSENYELTPHKLVDAPPYPHIFSIPCRIERPRPGSGNKENRASKGGNIGKVYESEDIDAEAEEFIKHEHRKFLLSKWLSMNGG